MAVRGERGGEGWRRGHSGDGGLVHDSRQTDRTLEAVVEKRKDGSMAFSLQWCLYRVEPLEQHCISERPHPPYQEAYPRGRREL